jgi:hydroxypyruvate isomerase
MPRFAANLSWLYTEHPFEDRFAAAARDGFTAVECLFPYGHPPARIDRLLRDQGLTQVLFNAPPGDWAAGDRGLAGLPGREREFRDGIHRALEYACAVGCPRVHVMAGAVQGDPASQWATCLDNLGWAAGQAGAAGITLLVEAINPHDMPGYLLTRQAQAHEAVEAIGSPHLRVQMDLYHCAMAEDEDVATLLRRHLPTGRVAHLQIAGMPGRHEPDVGLLDIDHLCGLIDGLGYDGWVGCEYRPASGDTSAGLGWLRRLGALGMPGVAGLSRPMDGPGGGRHST